MDLTAGEVEPLLSGQSAGEILGAIGREEDLADMYFALQNPVALRAIL